MKPWRKIILPLKIIPITFKKLPGNNFATSTAVHIDASMYDTEEDGLLRRCHDCEARCSKVIVLACINIKIIPSFVQLEELYNVRRLWIEGLLIRKATPQTASVSGF